MSSTTTELTRSEMEAKLAELKEERDALLKAKRAKVELRVSAKGAVSIYGLRRFPITLYVDEWDQITEMRDEIEEFIEVNGDKLRRKGDPALADA